MIHANSGAKEAKIRAVVIRADGRVEDLGVVSYWHANPVKRAIGKAIVAFNRLRKGK